VVRVSSYRSRLDLDELPDPVCEACGFPIEETGQECIALDDGGECVA
jgi:hypothetical protein